MKNKNHPEACQTCHEVRDCVCVVAKTTAVYVLWTANGRLTGRKVFTDKKAAEFAAAGMNMFAPADCSEDDKVYVTSMELFSGDEEDFMATAGLGPKARKRA